MKKKPSDFNLPLTLDTRNKTPLYRQLRDELVTAIKTGRLKSGDRLPSTREISKTLGISRIVATAAYEELAANGYIDARQGSGTRVADIPAVTTSRPLQPEKTKQAGKSPRISFEPGYPDAAAMKPESWRKSWRYMATEPIHNRRDPQGDTGLRSALADYVARTRGFVASPNDIIVTSGTFQALDLVALAMSSSNQIGLENPGYIRARTIFADRNFALVPLPVGPNGLVIENLPRCNLRLIYVTPSHQYPLGGTMPVAA